MKFSMYVLIKNFYFYKDNIKHIWKRNKLCAESILNIWTYFHAHYHIQIGELVCAKLNYLAFNL